MSDTSITSRLAELLEEHRIAVSVAVGLAVAAVAGGWVETPKIAAEIPGWWPAVLIGLVAAWVAAKVGGGRITDLIPDDEGILLVEFRADEVGGRIWEVSEDRFDAMDVEPDDGILARWDSSRPVYEVRDYDPGDNRAVANWRVPASKLAEHQTVDDAMSHVADLRESYETDARRGRWIRRRLPSILRTLDRERAEDQMRALERHTAPAIGDADTISEVIRRDMPDELVPDTFRAAGEMTDDDEVTNDTASDTMTDPTDDDTDDAQTELNSELETGADTSEVEP